MMVNNTPVTPMRDGSGNITGVVMGDIKPDDPKIVRQRLDILKMEIAYAETLIKALEERLNPILSPYSGTGSVTTCLLAIAESQVADEIKDDRDRLLVVTEKMSNLLERLQI